LRAIENVFIEELLKKCAKVACDFILKKSLNLHGVSINFLLKKVHKNFVKSELMRTHVQFIGTIQKKEWREGSDFCQKLSCWTSTSPRI